MPSTAGRRVTLPLVNRSGGAVAIGDVVVVGDGVNNGCFTTTTTANFTARHIGIAQEAIASLATGRILVRGYAAIVNSAGSLTRDHYLYTSGVAKEASGSATRGAGAFGQVLSTGTDTDALIWGQPETGAGAPSYTGQPWASGTSFPGAPSNNDHFTRTDRDIEYFYDGTRWLSLNEYVITMGILDGLHPITNTGALLYGPCDHGDNQTWVTRYRMNTLIAAGLNDATNFWTCQMQVSGVGTVSLGASFSTAADGVGTWAQRAVNIGAALVGTDNQFRVTATKTLSPGGLYGMGAVFYRLIG